MVKPRLRARMGGGDAMPTIGADAGTNAVKPHRAIGDTAHRAASYFERDVAAWRPRAGSADADLLPELGTLRNRARDIDRNNGVAKGGLQTIVDNVVGTGLRLSPQPDYKALGKTKEWATEWSTNVKSRWAGYAWTTACDAQDTLTFDQLTAQALHSELSNGDAVAPLMWMPERGDGFATKIMMIESDRLSNPNAETDSPTLRGGVKLDAIGAPVGYYIANKHPGDSYLGGLFASYPEWEFIPRRMPFGRLRMLHVYDKQRSGQSRGKPLLTSVLSQFKQADRYVNAEIAAAVVNGMVAGLITTPMEMDDILDLFKNRPEEYLQMRRDHAVGLQSGSLIPLAPGDDFKSFLPQRPAAQFGTFMTNVYRIIGVGMDMPYELVLKDFSQTNYSSARAAMLEAWRSFNRRRDALGTKWCDPVYWNWLEEQVNANKIDAPGFYENRVAYQRCKWIGPGRGWVDQVREATAAQIRIDSGVSTLEDECAEQGKDWEEVMDQRATELERADELGLPQIIGGKSISTADAPVDGTNPNDPNAPPREPGPNEPDDKTQTLFTYRMSNPRAAAQRAAIAHAERKASMKISDVVGGRVDALADRVDALANVVERAPAPAPAPPATVHIHDERTATTTIKTATPSAPDGRVLIEHEVLEVDAAGLPSRVRQTYAMPDPAQPEPKPEPPPRSGTVLRRVEKVVTERDDQNRIVRVQETELAP